MSYPKEIENIWNLVKESFRKDLSSTAFDLWFGELELSDFLPEKNEIVFLASSEFTKRYMTENYKARIEKQFIEISGMVVSIRFDAKPASVAQEHALSDFLKTGSASTPAPIEDGAEIAQRSRYTFDNFIVGESNKFARAVCWGVATNPASDYNPLFLYGPSGVGKTHLLYAVINKMYELNPSIRVIYTKGDEFVNYMVECMTRNDMPTFRDHYRKCDVLLIDDIQFIAGKQGLQEEVFHTFQALFDEGKQIILASDRPPKDINPLELRLRSRFEQGLLADINPPDLELRTSIIKKKAGACNINIPPEVLNFLAENLRSNIRQIEGTIRKLAAKSLIEGRTISMQLAKDCVSAMLGDAEPLNVTIEKIFAAVSKKYNISVDEIKGKKRNAEIANARHISIYLIHKITEISFPHIGKIFNRDHSTVLSSVNVIKTRIIKETLFENDIDLLIKEITQH